MYTSSSDQKTAQFEPLKGHEKDISVDISVETSNTKDAQTLVQLGKIDEFTAKLVAIIESFINAFMNEVFGFKNKDASVKQAAFNEGNSTSQENYTSENFNFLF